MLMNMWISCLSVVSENRTIHCFNELNMLATDAIQRAGSFWIYFIDENVFCKNVTGRFERMIIWSRFFFCCRIKIVMMCGDFTNASHDYNRFVNYGNGFDVAWATNCTMTSQHIGCNSASKYVVDIDLRNALQRMWFHLP